MKPFAEHMQSEVAAFGFDKDVDNLMEIKKEQFLELLNIPQGHAATRTYQFKQKSFLQSANAMAKLMKDQCEHLFSLYLAPLLTFNFHLVFADKYLLVFNSTRTHSHGGHVIVTGCKPDYTAAFKNHWNGKKTLWPCICFVGESASKGKASKDQEKQAISHLYYLLLARPDLHVVQGTLTSEMGVRFLFGIGGAGICSFSVKWDNNELSNFMFSFIYRLYDPGDFADLSYSEMVPNLIENHVTYNVHLNGSTINNLRPIYASNPFGTRTHILSNPASEVMVNNKLMTVLKDQLCRVGTRFNEYDILTRVHDPETVPGVVEAVSHEVINIPRDFCPDRKKHRMGLHQLGRLLITIPTLAQVLEVIFDILEGKSSYPIHFRVPMALQCCDICVSSVKFFIVTSAEGISSMLMTVPPLQLVPRLVEQTRWPYQRSSHSASSSTFLVRGV